MAGDGSGCERWLDESSKDGIEPTAVTDTFRHPFRAWRIGRKGVEVDAPMAPEIDLSKARRSERHSSTAAPRARSGAIDEGQSALAILMAEPLVRALG